MEEKILILITSSSEEEAVHIAERLLDERLIACANLLQPIRSLYRWQGRVCDDREVLLLCKSRRALFGQVRDRVISLHSYEVPEVVALALAEGSPSYLQWIADETREP